MASIRKRGDKYIVVYDYRDDEGKRRQKHDAFTDQKEAKKHKAFIEMRKVDNKLLMPSKKSLAEYLDEWSPIHAQKRWTYNTYEVYKTLSENHIKPHIGHLPIQDIVPLDIERMYEKLRKTRCRGTKSYGKKEEDTPFLSSTTIRHIHMFLSSAFAKAVEWGIIDKSPMPGDAPKKIKSKRKIWRPQEVSRVLKEIEPSLLRLAVHTAFIESLRIGETMAIQWNQIDFAKGAITIDKTLQRVNLQALIIIPPDELIFTFPVRNDAKKSRIILKTPKTDESSRVVFMTDELKADWLSRKAVVDCEKLALGDEYNDYDLVFALPNGNPIEPKLCEKWFKAWQKNSGIELEELVFHELRHSSSTYKMNLSQGDFKSVQGDTGIATPIVLMNTYTHIEDERRKALTNVIQTDFYDIPASAAANKPSAVANERMVKEIVEQFATNPALLQSVLTALYAQQNK